MNKKMLVILFMFMTSCGEVKNICSESLVTKLINDLIDDKYIVFESRFKITCEDLVFRCEAENNSKYRCYKEEN